jgi:signal peptidase II
VAAAAWARALGVAAAVVAADQLSKAWVNHSIARGEIRNVFLGIDFVNVRNRGVAFGLLSGGRGIVLLLTAAALVALLGYFATHRARPLLWLPTGLLVGGALGNLTDRLRGESVTDFIDLPLWPPFNLADASITVGVLLLLFVLERGEGAAVKDEAGDDRDPRPA